LEHIHAKSRKDKVIEEFNEFKDINGKQKFSVHCIGNLVLLEKDDNSALRANEFKKKKEILFDNAKYFKESLSLLHTLTVFSASDWGTLEIQLNYYEALINICDTYAHDENKELKKKRDELLKSKKEVAKRIAELDNLTKVCVDREKKIMRQNEGENSNEQ
jgi:hypothetical protein